MELLIEGAVDVYPLVGLAVVVASALNSIAILRAYFRIFTGRHFQTAVMLRSRASERIAVVVLSILVLGGGLWPQPGVASRNHAAEALMKQRRPAAVFAPSEESANETENPDSPEGPVEDRNEQASRRPLGKQYLASRNSLLPCASSLLATFENVRGDPSHR